jgi:hypothetical protein
MGNSDEPESVLSVVHAVVENFDAAWVEEDARGIDEIDSVPSHVFVSLSVVPLEFQLHAKILRNIRTSVNRRTPKARPHGLTWDGSGGRKRTAW